MIETTLLPQILGKNSKDELFDNEVLMQAITLKETLGNNHYRIVDH